MVTKPTGRKRGRPEGSRKDFRTDRDILAIALAWTFIAGDLSENSAYKLAAEVAARKSHSGDPLAATVTRLRKKGTRWLYDPVARDQVMKIVLTLAKGFIEFEKLGGFDDPELALRIARKSVPPASN